MLVVSSMGIFSHMAKVTHFCFVLISTTDFGSIIGGSVGGSIVALILIILIIIIAGLCYYHCKCHKKKKSKLNNIISYSVIVIA